MQRQEPLQYSVAKYLVKRVLGYAFPVMTTSIVGYASAVDLLLPQSWAFTRGIRSVASATILLAKTVASTRCPSRCFLRAGLVL